MRMLGKMWCGRVMEFAFLLPSCEVRRFDIYRRVKATENVTQNLHGKIHYAPLAQI